jgi:hypothetical protein
VTAPEPPNSEAGSAPEEPPHPSTPANGETAAGRAAIDGAAHQDGLSPAGGDSDGFHTWRAEDVLAGPPPEPVQPRERTRFTRRRDLIAAAVIVVALVVAGALVWQNADFRATASTQGAAPPSPAGPEVFPPSLGEVWRARSAATPEPVVVGPVVVTGEGGEVAGRDPLTGEVVWSYRRDLPLCAVSGAFEHAIAVYRGDGGFLPDGAPRAEGACSEVTSLYPENGGRHTARNWDAELGAELTDDGTYLTSAGKHLITTLRSDLVETMEYGQVPAPVVPERQPRTGCSFDSVHMAAGRIGVIERCPDDLADRLTVYKATGKDADRPEVVFSTVLATESAQVVAMTDRFTAVAVPDPAALLVYGDDGNQASSTPLELGPGGLARSGSVAETAMGTGAFYWFTGSSAVALSMEDLKPKWTVPGAFGPGAAFAGRMLVPVADGLAVIDQTTGERVGVLPVARDGYTGPIAMAAIGPIVLEQRGPLLVALR